MFASAALKLVEEGASVVYALAALFVIVGSGSLFLGRELGRRGRAWWLVHLGFALAMVDLGAPLVALVVLWSGWSFPRDPGLAEAETSAELPSWRARLPGLVGWTLILFAGLGTLARQYTTYGADPYERSTLLEWDAPLRWFAGQGASTAFLLGVLCLVFLVEARSGKGVQR